MSKRHGRSGKKGNPFAAKNANKKSVGSAPQSAAVNVNRADMNAAVAAQNSGDFQTAKKLYEQILARDPNHGYALIYLGTIYYHNGDYNKALEYMDRGYAAGARDETYCINKGLVLDKFGKHEEAIALYKKALEIVPDSVEALFNMGNSYYKIRDFSKASEALEKSLAVSPDNFLIEYQLACSLQDGQKHQKALEHFKKLHEAKPDDARVLCGIGMSLAGTYKHREGLEYLHKALQTAPENYIFNFNIANIYKALSMFSESRKHFEKALAANPNSMEALIGMGRMLVDTGKFEESREYFNRAIEIDPSYHSAYSGMGTSYMKNNVREAIEWYDKALALKPDADDVIMLKGYAQNLQGSLEDAEASLRKAIELNPDYAEHYQNLANVLVVQGRVGECLELCKESLLRNKKNHRAFSNILLYMHYVPQSSPDDLILMHKKYNNLFGPIFAPPSVPPYQTVPNPDKKLRIGFVSADLRRHSVAYFLEPLLRNHNREQVEMICYASVKTPDAFTKALASHCAAWRDIIGLSDFEAAELIHRDGVDILIDLGGHTADNRLPIFMRRPAPLQVSWLGYPDTTGLDCIDYRIVDEFTDPVGMEKFSTEKLFRLPGGFHCYGKFPDAPDVGSAPCLENGYITFGSFNNYAKVSSETHYLWAQILKLVPNSRLLLKSLGLNDDYMIKLVHERFEKLGIDPGRVEVLGKTQKISDHLRTYQRVDIALDTYPYNGTTTTFEAMWMGVPVISLSALTHASLVGKSILMHTNLEDLACSTPEQYVSVAVALANNHELINQLRQTMRERMEQSPFLDEKGFWNKFHGALRFMWKECCEANCNTEGFFAYKKAKRMPDGTIVDEETGNPLPVVSNNTLFPSAPTAASSSSMTLQFGSAPASQQPAVVSAAGGLKLQFASSAPQAAAQPAPATNQNPSPAQGQGLKLNFSNAPVPAPQPPQAAALAPQKTMTPAADQGFSLNFDVKKPAPSAQPEESDNSTAGKPADGSLKLNLSINPDSAEKTSPEKDNSSDNTNLKLNF